MKDYGKMSDFEINKAVALGLGIKVLECNGKIFGGIERSIDNVTSVIGVIDYCNNPSDAWPIINRERIGVYPSEGPEFMPWIAAKNAISVTDKNPLRAAMIVYLMMKDEEK